MVNQNYCSVFLGHDAVLLGELFLTSQRILQCLYHKGQAVQDCVRKLACCFHNSLLVFESKDCLLLRMEAL